MSAASASQTAITDEKERKTLVFLLVTDLSGREILFGKLQLPVLKKTASGTPSTDEEVLEPAQQKQARARSRNLCRDQRRECREIAGCIYESFLVSRSKNDDMNGPLA